MADASSFSLKSQDMARYVGVVSQVSPSAVGVTLLGAPVTTQSPFADSRMQVAEVGEFVLIQCAKGAVYGKILDVGIPEGQRIQGGEREIYPLARVQLLSTVDIEAGIVSPGVKSKPRIGNKVFLAPPEIVQLVSESGVFKVDTGLQGEEPLFLSFAGLLNAASTPIRFTPENLYGRHCAVLGSTGSGKSWTVARMVEETSRLRSKVILFDATGEYCRLGGATLHVHLGSDPDPRKGSFEVVLPYYELTEGDLFAIFQPSGEAQAPKLRAAMKSLKLLKVVPGLAVDGLIMKANKAKEHFEEACAKHVTELESPEALFDIGKLTRQIENECVRPYRSSVEPQFWGDVNSYEQALCVPLINRVQDIIKSPNLASIFDPAQKPSLLKVIDDFIGDEKFTVLRISLNYLSFFHHAREIVANALGRYLLSQGRLGRFRKRPLLVVLDEAHQFLNKTLGNESEAYPLDSFGLIAKEGRKYSLSICLATQRPRDIPEDVLSQMGAFLVHRLINDLDRSVVERASGELDQSALSLLPALAPGEAVIVGVDFPIPLGVRIEAPLCQPDSRGPDYQNYWR